MNPAELISSICDINFYGNHCKKAICSKKNIGPFSAIGCTGLGTAQPHGKHKVMNKFCCAVAAWPPGTIVRKNAKGREKLDFSVEINEKKGGERPKRG